MVEFHNKVFKRPNDESAFDLEHFYYYILSHTTYSAISLINGNTLKVKIIFRLDMRKTNFL